MSQRRSRASNEVDLSPLQDAIKECVRFVVCREGSKLPIKRAEIIKHINTNNQTPANQVNVVIVEANKILKRVYGYKLVQVEAKSGIQYIVVLDEPCQDAPLSNAVDPHQRKLLVAALTHIYMTNGPVKEEDMWKFLEEASLLEENDHAGRKILTNTFTRQMYLRYHKIGEGDLAKYVFEWGQRAEEEVPKMFLLNKMAEALEKEPNHWYEQFKIATDQQAPAE
ncbi:non-structural maintenance of chromosomes element 3 homolog [Aricia agestis]|uniref:non-structural maintenance of chromosomes element 3 homolog n=1 Tax=Aricia agestis TaxID=91739 RepID=UPI001C20748E|nr:non-structural maintenance of chromosomes element 3 homolog [Aricia agestis]